MSALGPVMREVPVSTMPWQLSLQRVDELVVSNRFHGQHVFSLGCFSMVILNRVFGKGQGFETWFRLGEKAQWEVRESARTLEAGRLYSLKDLHPATSSSSLAIAEDMGELNWDWLLCELHLILWPFATVIKRITVVAK